MDPNDVAAQIDRLSFAILVLIAAVLVAIAYILTLPIADPRSSDPTCPLHKMPRSKCGPESHE